MLDGVLSNNPSAAVEAVELQTGNSRQEADEKTRGVTRNKCMIFLGILLAISIVANIILTAFLVKKDRCAQCFCPDTWIGFQDKCYYFSKEEKDWNSSRYNCLSQNADLVTIDTIEEKDFLRRYKCASDHWVWRDRTKDQTRQWVNGSIANN
ncbi:C-type lectin domain family 2 member B isoform X3 [Eubalaena glacialis]|nr:C-type lectin domain family 2 member B isoform X2 [Eubalaena glacialis]XP_061060941.1 C-type lectin domain family 2 member B isoform X3 [Eubalaena glacialis]